MPYPYLTRTFETPPDLTRQDVMGVCMRGVCAVAQCACLESGAGVGRLVVGRRACRTVALHPLLGNGDRRNNSQV